MTDGSRTEVATVGSLDWLSAALSSGDFERQLAAAEHMAAA
jgi:hypothetical protein